MHQRKQAASRSGVWGACALSLFTLLGVGLISRYALLTVVLDGLAAAMVLIPAVLVGLWLVPIFRLGTMPLRWHLLLAAALGLGATALLVLLLGLAGYLQRPIWIAILSVCTVAGVIRFRSLLSGIRPNPPRLDQSRSGRAAPTAETDAGAWRYLWVLACPFLILACLAASNAPGLIWREEGLGYDVLEYHLELPKEYLQAGHIGYLPHNVYANFPANVEMFYLLAMTVLDDVRDIGTTSNMIHLLFGLLTVFAAWVAGREWSARAGIVCAVSMATVGWFPYLAGLAYVENGMLFFGMTAVAAMLRYLRLSPTVRGDRAKGKADKTAGVWGWVAVAGAIAGLACGCKYTAWPMIALPLALAPLSSSGQWVSRNVTASLLFMVGTITTLSPWLVKNQVMTSNPVFPLANSLFKASPPGWGDEQTHVWDRSHRASLQERTTLGRLEAFGKRVVWDHDQRFGPAIFLLAGVGLVGRRRLGVDGVLMAILVVQILVWLFATHLFARFAVVMLIPLVLLCGRVMIGGGGAGRRRVIMAVLLGGGTWNLLYAARLQRAESPGGAPASLIYDGELPGYEYFAVVNHELPQDAKILLVGDAKAFYFQRRVGYTVVFNRNPFFETVQTARTDKDVVRWLHDRGYTHVLVHWGELRRLASTYGLSPPVDPRRLANLFGRLSRDGLVRVRSFKLHKDGGRYVDLYELIR